MALNAISHSQAHITAISHRSSTACGRRRTSASKASKLSVQTVTTTKIMAGV